jgi:hypothetical protein
MSSFNNLNQETTGYESDSEIDHKIHLRNIASLTAFYEEDTCLTTEEKVVRDAEYSTTAAEYEFWLLFEIRGYEDGNKGITEVKRICDNNVAAAATQTAIEDEEEDKELSYEDDDDENNIDIDDLLQDKIEDYVASWLSENDDENDDENEY